MAMVRFIMLVLLAAVVPGHAFATLASDRVAAIDQAMSRFIEVQKTHGLGGASTASVAISVAGESLYQKGFGEEARGRAADGATRYSIGSLSKQVTAVAVLRAIEKGALARRSGRRITLDTDIREVFDNVEHWLRDRDTPIRIRNLLSMTSNLPNFTRRPPALTDPWGSIEAPRLLDAVKRYAPHGWPDTFEYNNTGYFLLAELLDRLCAAEPCRSDEPGHDARVRDVLGLAGMSATAFHGDSVGSAYGVRLAEPGYRRRPAFINGMWLKGSADLDGSAVDLQRFNAAFMDGRLLSAVSRDLMWSEWARVSPEIYYGLGWFIEHKAGYDIFSHTGSVPGYTSVNLIARRGDGAPWASVTILTNGEEVDGLDRLAESLLDIAWAQ